MSTWLYLECMDHDPPIRADSESGQHLSDLPQIREDIAERDKRVALYIETEWDWPSDRWRRNTVSFLAQHPKCHIHIRDEYGREHLIVDLPEGEDMAEHILNKKQDEVADDHPKMPVDRVKMIVSEATTSSHTETERTAIIDRTVERRSEASETDLRLHALNYAMNNTYVIERTFDKADGGAKPIEYANAMLAMADIYLKWLKS